MDSHEHPVTLAEAALFFVIITIYAVGDALLDGLRRLKAVVV